MYNLLIGSPKNYSRKHLYNTCKCLLMPFPLYLYFLLQEIMLCLKANISRNENDWFLYNLIVIYNNGILTIYYTLVWNRFSS